MSANGSDLTIKKVRLYAVTGGKTKNGGILKGSSSLTTDNKPAVLEGDEVIYPDGKQAFVLKDKSTFMESVGKDGVTMLTAAAVGTLIDNGDIITDAGQQTIALLEYYNNKFACVYFDEDNIKELKDKGLL